jgi:hypothetical protein
MSNEKLVKPDGPASFVQNVCQFVWRRRSLLKKLVRPREVPQPKSPEFDPSTSYAAAMMPSPFYEWDTQKL